MIARAKNAWAALVLALSRECSTSSIEISHQKIGALVSSGAPIEDIEQQMTEGDWKQRVCSKREAIRVNFYFALVAFLAVVPTWFLARDWWGFPLFLSLVWFLELVFDLFRLQKRARFESFWQEALVELKRGDRKSAAYLLQNFVESASEKSNSKTA